MIRPLKLPQRSTSITSSMVLIPSMNSETVQSILEINKTLFKILLEYQNNGWLDEPEHKIFHTRLQNNLTYLASIAEYLMKKSQNVQFPPLPDLTPVEIPKKLLSELSTHEMLEQIIGPPMALDLNSPVGSNDPYTYVPTPPVVLPPQVAVNLPMGPGSVQAPVWVNERITHEHMLKKLNVNAEDKKESPIKSEADPIIEGLLEDDEDDEEYVPQESEEEDDDPLSTADFYFTNLK